jgi:hypothetical protein
MKSGGVEGCGGKKNSGNEKIKKNNCAMKYLLHNPPPLHFFFLNV